MNEKIYICNCVCNVDMCDGLKTKELSNKKIKRRNKNKGKWAKKPVGEKRKSKGLKAFYVKQMNCFENNV